MKFKSYSGRNPWLIPTFVHLPKIIYPMTCLLSSLGFLRDILRDITAASLVYKHNSLLTGLSHLLPIFPVLHIAAWGVLQNHDYLSYLKSSGGFSLCLEWNSVILPCFLRSEDIWLSHSLSPASAATLLQPHSFCLSVCSWNMSSSLLLQGFSSVPSPWNALSVALHMVASFSLFGSLVLYPILREAVRDHTLTRHPPWHAIVVPCFHFFPSALSEMIYLTIESPVSKTMLAHSRHSKRFCWIHKFSLYTKCWHQSLGLKPGMKKWQHVPHALTNKYSI